MELSLPQVSVTQPGSSSYHSGEAPPRCCHHKGNACWPRSRPYGTIWMSEGPSQIQDTTVVCLFIAVLYSSQTSAGRERVNLHSTNPLSCFSHALIDNLCISPCSARLFSLCHDHPPRYPSCWGWFLWEWWCCKYCRCSSAQCKRPLPLVTGAILGSDNKAQVLAKPNVISCVLPLLP